MIKKTVASISTFILLFQLFSFTAFAATLTETNCTGEFDAGTDSNTECSGNTLILSDGQTSGTFTSQVLDAGSSATWSNLAWSPSAPYGKELPSNGGSDSGYSEGNIDMSNNVLYLKMNEASWNGSSDEVIDYSGEGNHGTAAGDATTTSGKLNNAGTLDGTGDYVTVNDSNSLDISSAITMSAWIKTGTTNKGIIAKGPYNSTSNGLYVMAIKNTTNNLSCSFNNTGIAVLGSTVITDNAWHHIACTYDANAGGSEEVKVYVDGVQEGTGDYSTAIGTDNNPLRIGTYYSSTYDLNGQIDEVAIWSEALTATEILDIYKRGALNASFDIASCDDAACSGETLSGDYNELDNSTNGLPSLSINPSENRYFQYKATLTGDGTYEPAIEDITLTYSTSGGGGGEGVPEFSTYVYILTFIVCGSIFFYYKPQLRKL